MAKIIDNIPDGELCLQSVPSSDELPVEHEVIVPLPTTFMGFPVVVSDDVPSPMDGMRFGGPELTAPPVRWSIEIEKPNEGE